MLLSFGASHLALAAGGQQTGSLAMQLPWFSLLPDLCEAQPQGNQSQRGGRPVRSQLTLLCFSQIVPAAKLGSRPLKWLFVKEIYGLKWSLTPLQSAFVPSSPVGKQLWF